MVEAAHRQTLLLGLLTTALYRLCGQCAISGDALAILGLGDPPGAAVHSGVATLLRQWVELLGRAGIGVHAAGLWFAALALGLGTMATFASALRLSSHRPAWLCALLAAVCPAVAFAATRVGVDTARFAMAALCVWAAVAWAQRPTWWRALAAGLLSGAAHALGPTLALLPVVTVPLFLLVARPARRGLYQQAGLCLLAHLSLAVLWLGADLVAGWSGPARVAEWPRLLYREVLRPGLPLVVVLIAALCQRRHRVPALLLCGALALHLLFMGQAAGSGDGAVLLPLVPAMALLAMRVLTGSRFAVPLLVLACLLSAAKVAMRSECRQVHEFGEGLRAATAGESCALIIGTRADEAALLVDPQPIEVLRVAVLTRGPQPSADEVLADLRRRLRSGQRVMVTAEAESSLRDLAFARAHELTAPLVLGLLGFRLRSVRVGSFRAKELLLP